MLCSHFFLKKSFGRILAFFPCVWLIFTLSGFSLVFKGKSSLPHNFGVWFARYFGLSFGCQSSRQPTTFIKALRPLVSALFLQYNKAKSIEKKAIIVEQSVLEEEIHKQCFFTQVRI